MPELFGFKKLVKFTISMMMNVRSILKYEVFLFNSTTSEYASNPLKDFVYYLRFQGKRGQISFSLSCGNDSLHPNLTIGENFTLDSISKSLIHNSEEHLNKKLLSIENEYTVKLINMLPKMETKLSDLSDETITLISVVKSLLSKTEYLFLVDFEKNLSEKNRDLIKKAIEIEATEFGRKILIRSTCPDKWIDLATNIIEKKDSGEFANRVNALCTLNEKQKKETPYQFTLIKKVS